jgi:hypothetical protein
MPPLVHTEQVLPAHRARACILAPSEERSILKAAITGHQQLGSPETVRWVSETIATVVDDLGVTKGFTCLAIGADQLFAKILHDRHVPFVAVIACAQIESPFSSDEDRASFCCLLAIASETIRLPFDAPSEAAYFEAGKAVVNESDTVIAVWDGKPAKGLGGTADIVQYARVCGKKVIHVDLVARKVGLL